MRLPLPCMRCKIAWLKQKLAVKKSKVARDYEYVCTCPNCKTFETLWFIGDRLVPTKKFIQKDSGIYHDCGSSEPCRLFPIYLHA